MKKILLLSVFFVQYLFVFAQTDATGTAESATAQETNKIDQIAKLTDDQKANVTKYLKEYYNHIDDLQKAKDDLQKLKENIKMLSALIKGEELGFNDNMKDVLTKRQYDKCSEYLKDRENAAKKKYGEPKKVAKNHTKTNQGS